MDSPLENWYNPPEVHEINNCFFCHQEGYHDEDQEWWAKHACYECLEELESKEN